MILIININTSIIYILISIIINIYNTHIHIHMIPLESTIPPSTLVTPQLLPSNKNYIITSLLTHY